MTEIVLELHKNHDGLRFVHAEIRGHKLRLSVDSGATHTVLDATVASRLNLSTEICDGVASGFMMRAHPVRVCGRLSLVLGTLTISELAPIVLDLTALNGALIENSGVSVDGVLGADLLWSLSAVIDYQAETLRLRQGAARSRKD